MTEETVFKKVAQVGLVVKDLNESMRKYWEKYKIGPWSIWTFDPSTVKDMTVHGKRVDYAMRLAVTMIGDIIWEMIQPLDDKSIYAEFLKKHGEGLHHILFEADNVDATIAYFQGKGVELLQSGTWKDMMKYAYLDTEADLSFITEVYNPPAPEDFPPPDETYP